MDLMTTEQMTKATREELEEALARIEEAIRVRLKLGGKNYAPMMAALGVYSKNIKAEIARRKK